MLEWTILHPKLSETPQGTYDKNLLLFYLLLMKTFVTFHNNANF